MKTSSVIVHNQRIRRVFEDQARVYSNDRAQSHSFCEQKKTVLDLIDGVAGSVLDIGCGGGYLEQDLLEKGLTVYAMDLSMKMLRLAKDRARTIKSDNGPYLVAADLEQVPFPDNSFDTVICMGVLEYLVNYKTALKEMCRILKPNGNAVISTQSRIAPSCILYRLFASACGPIVRRLNHSRTKNGKSATYKVYHIVPWKLKKAAEEAGFKNKESRYCNFSFFPLDRLLPGFSLWLNRKMGRASRSKAWGWLGKQYITKIEKANGANVDFH